MNGVEGFVVWLIVACGELGWQKAGIDGGGGR